MRYSRVLIGVMAGLCAFLSIGSRVCAQEGEKIIEIEIRGSAHVSLDRIEDNLKMREGAVFSEEAFSKDIKNLYENDSLRVLAVSREIIKVPGGIKIVIHIKQDDRITEIRFQGVVSEDEEDLRSLMGLRPESIVSQYLISTYADMIKEHYRSKGYYLAEVNIWQEPTEEGIVAVFEVFEGEKITVKDIQFVGVQQLEPGELEKRMETSDPTLWIFTSSLKSHILQKDIVLLNEYARAEGYLDAKISLEEIRLDEDSDGAVIVIRVQEGQRYTIGRIDLLFGTSREPQAKSQEFTREKILELVETKPGDVYRKIRIERDLRRIEQFYGERGYIRAQVGFPEEFYDEHEPVVNLTFYVNEDVKKYVRDVIVAGNKLTKDKVIRREITLYPGEVFDTTEINWSKNQLNALQFFVNEQGQPRVYTETRRTEDENYEDFYVEVEEGRTGFFFFTIGASTDGGIFGGTSINKRNFDITDMPSSPLAAPVEFFTNDAFHGGGQSLRLSAMPGTVYSSYDLTFHEPYFFDTQPTPISFTFSAYRRSTDYNEYDIKRMGIAPVLGKRLSREWTVSLGFRNEQIEMDNVTRSAPLAAQELEGTTGRRSLETTLRYRNVDNPYDPKRGLAAGLSYEYTGGILGNDLEMNRIILDSTVHIPVLETSSGKIHKVILSSNVGWSEEQGAMENVPIFERFFVGGSSGRFPVRGFEWREIGPRQQGEPVGGKFAYTVSAEYMVPLYSYYDSYYDVETPIFRGVIFVDAGTVAPDIYDSRAIGRLRSSYGVGLRITLPVFAGLPIALDYGIPWKDYPGDKRRSFSFSISHWF